MYNTDALNYSKKVLPDQIKFLLETKPYVDNITIAGKENDTLPKCDYMYGIDARLNCNDGTTKTVQFKHRKDENNDFVILARKLTGKAVENGNIGFNYQNTRYTLMPYADYYVETIQDKHYCVSREEINCIEVGLSKYEDAAEYISAIKPKPVITDDGSKIYCGEYFVYIKLPMLARMLQGIFRYQNPYIFEQE